MSSDRPAGFASQIQELSEAMLEIVEVQRAALQPAGDAGSGRPADSTALLGRLDALSERLQALHHEAAESGAEAAGPARFGEIDVERINVIEPDGSLRMTVSSAARAPDPVVDGFTFQRQGGNDAGIIFFNEEGDECGGLVFGGQAREGGHEAGGALLFDQFKQDQIVGIQYRDIDGRRVAGLKVWERPDTAFREMAERFDRVWQLPEGPERTRGLERMEAEGALGAERLFVGKDDDGSSQLRLHDRSGKVRVSLRVEASGSPRLEFLDAEGKVMLVLPAD